MRAFAKDEEIQNLEYCEGVNYQESYKPAHVSLSRGLPQSYPLPRQHPQNCDDKKPKVIFQHVVHRNYFNILPQK